MMGLPIWGVRWPVDLDHMPMAATPGEWSAGPLGWAACRSAAARCGDTKLRPFGAPRPGTGSGETMGKRGYAAALLTTIALLCTPAPGASAAPAISTISLRDAVTLEAVRAHQAEFQEFADLSEGTREASTLGYQLSADYVAGKMEAAGYEVTRQPFEYNFFEELAAPTVVGTSLGFPFTYTDGEDISTMDYSGSGTVTGVVQGVNDNIVPLPVGQPDSTSNAGCEDADFTGFTGDIALIQRGTCFFSEKIANAVEAGAEAVIIFNEGNSEERSGVDFGQASFPQDVPVIEMSAEAGAALVEYIEAEAEAGRQVTLTVTTSTVSEVRESENVIAETTTGRTDRVVVSGAHLDSVIEGPGINDNGSGSAAQLEVALKMAKLGIEPVNQVRFIWFGAEEAGLVGSAYYVSQLSKRELKNIAVMLNFDMVGSPNRVGSCTTATRRTPPPPARPARAWLKTSSLTSLTRSGGRPSPPRSTAARTTTRSWLPGFRPVACLPALKTSKLRSRRPSGAALLASRSTRAITRTATHLPTSISSRWTR